MLKIYKLLLLAVFSIPLIGFSQVSLYGFNQTTTTYTPITGGTVYGNTTTDDQRFVDPAVPLGGTVTTGVGIPIGFNFTYNGQVYDRIAINNNGWISFGSSLLTPSVNNASSSSYTAISATSTATPAHLRNRVGGFARDLQGQVGSELRIETIGTAPNRVCVIQWTNYRRFGATGDIINFQIRLNETTNYVESVYGTCSTTNTGATITAQVGLSGSVNSDFNNRQGTWSATTAGTINTSNLTFITTNIPVNNSRFLWGPAPAAPAAPTQDPGIPTCSAGTNINAVGAPTNPDETYYWQTTASGTSTTQPASTPLTVFANGTYFIRSYNSVLNVWSTANSITVTNFPVAAAPPAPTALANPACTPGTTISVPAPPLGLEYYWQGTVLNGSSQADLADSPFNVTNSGTYYVAAFDIASQCWSPTTSIVMTVDSQIPNNPIVAVDYLNLCAGATTGLISATTSSNNPGTLATTQAGGNGCNNGNMFNLTSAASPITITSLDITPNTTGAQTVAVYYKTGTYIGSEANLAAWTLVGNYPITGTIGTPINIDIADVNIPASSLYGFYVNFNAQYTNIAVGVTYSNADLTLTVGAGFCTAFSGPIAGRAFNGTIHYTKPVNGTATWFDAPTGGTVIGTGSPFETVGSSEMPIAVDGVYEFYVASTLGGCFSPNRELVTVNVNQIVVELGPIDVTCNGLAEGSFSLDSTVCGTGPFNYSVNGGAFGPIPTNLTAGTYSIVAQDASLATSSPVVVTISEPTAPQTLSASNITYFNATLSWTAQGSETSWVVEYGPAGFTPGTGTIVNATNDSIPISGLTEDTDYEFYVAAGCTPTSDVAGPFAFSTDVPFYTFDNQCGPGWTDISSTGTPAGFVSLDDDVVDVTLPWPWNVNGQTVTDIGIGTNGHVAFGTGAFVTYNPTVNGLYICNADLQSIDANGAYYQSIGTAPNRQFIIQWVGMQDWPAAGAGSPSASFEIIVDEASGEVYYIYDNAPATMPAYTAMAGIDIAVYTSNGNAIVQTTGTTNIQNNSCYHFYNAMCPNVQNFSGIIFSDDALLDWNPGAYNESTWTLVYGLEGFDPTIPGQEIGTFNLVSSDANFGGSLTQLTTYDVYIYSECAADGLTSDGFFYQFTTKPYCADPTTLAGTTDVDSLNLTWNWIANPGYDISQFNIQYSMEDLNDFTEVIANGTNNSDTVVDASLIPSGVYEVYVQAACLTGDTSNWVGPLSLVMPLENDTTCGAPLLNVDETQYIFNNTGATTSLGENAIAPDATGAQTTDGWINSTINSSLWYRFVAPSTGSVRINSTGRAYDGQIAVYELTNCDDFNTFSLLAANDDEIGGTSKAPNFTVCGLTPGSEYYILFDGFNGTQGEFAIMLKEIVLDAGTANPTAEICTGDDIVLFTTIAGFDNGGTWSSAIPSVNASISDSLFTSTGLAYQTFDFEYRVVDGCAYDTIISQVQIFAPSNAGLDGTITACRNQPINLFSGLNGVVDLFGQWYDPSNNPANENVTTLNFAGNYNYDYIVGNGVCPDDTSNVVVTVTSCNHLSIDEEIFEGVSIHPNPTAGILFIESGIQFDMTITDANGRFVSTNTTSVAIGTTSVDLSTVERGVYFVNLTNGTSSKVYRVIVQ